MCACVHATEYMVYVCVMFFRKTSSLRWELVITYSYYPPPFFIVYFEQLTQMGRIGLIELKKSAEYELNFNIIKSNYMKENSWRSF